MTSSLTQIAINPGTVYILRSSAYRETIVKVGRTERSSEIRAAELSRPTGIATPFEVLYEEEVVDCEQAERQIHDRLKQWRVNKAREFFDVPLKSAVRAVFETCLLINGTALQEQSRLAIWLDPGADCMLKLVALLQNAIGGTTSVRLIMEHDTTVAEIGLSNMLLVACTPKLLASLRRQPWIRDVQIYVPA